MKVSEIFKALEEGKIVINNHTNGRYKLIDGRLHVIYKEAFLWEAVQGFALLDHPNCCEIEKERVIDLAKVPPHEMVHINDAKVLAIKHLPDLSDGGWYGVITALGAGIYRRDGAPMRQGTSVFKFKDEERKGELKGITINKKEYDKYNAYLDEHPCGLVKFAEDPQVVEETNGGIRK